MNEIWYNGPSVQTRIFIVYQIADLQLPLSNLLHLGQFQSLVDVIKLCFRLRNLKKFILISEPAQKCEIIVNFK